MVECRPFDKPAYSKQFWPAFNQLCAETPTKRETCKRIRDNQQRFLEYQQKCLNRYDADVQQAIEHAGDIIREFSKGGCEAYDLSYVAEKVRRIQRRMDNIAERREMAKR